MTIFEKIFKEFNKAKIKYLVVGGVAVNLYGYMRYTGDLDILLLLDKDNLEKTEKIMKKLGYGMRLPVDIKALSDEKLVKKWLKEKNMTAYSFFPPVGNPIMLDILVEESLRFEKVVKNRVLRKMNKLIVPVVSIQDLIKMKRRANREQDYTDIKYLIKLKDL